MTTAIVQQTSFCRLLAWALALIVLTAAALPAGADDEVNTGYFGRVAIGGYDPVSYFTEARAVRGRQGHVYEWLGAIWHFSTEENKRMFAAEPLRYAPQYGGYCAIGVSEGTRTIDIDPEAWAIIDGKLYLNYSKSALGALNGKRIRAADEHWRTMQAEAAP